MTHAEYVSILETAEDSPRQIEAILAHTAACATCRREHRRADRALAALEPAPSLVEKLARWGAAAAVLAVLVAGLRGGSWRTPAATPARYRVIGDASGVVAYTPEGIIVGSGRTHLSSKEISR
jgi:hypothetical protein